jgi:hypothetical protein
MKEQIFKKPKLISALIILCGIIFSMIIYPMPTILSLILLGILIKNWEMVKWISITVILSFLIGSLMFAIINLTYNSFSGITFDGIWPAIYLILIIYGMGIVIEEDCQKPYIWIWNKMKTKKLMLN